MRVIYDLNGISQVGEKVMDSERGFIVKSLTTLTDNPTVKLINNYQLDIDFGGVDKVVTTIDEINNYYDDRIKNRNYQNEIDQKRRISSLALYEKYLV